MRLGLIYGAAALILVFTGAASAETLRYTAHLTGGQEVPPNTTTGTGDLTASLDTASKRLTYQATYSGLTGPATMAHFHGPAKAGQNAPPIVVVAHPASPINASAILTDKQISDLNGGVWYFNVHTAANPGGEIRGQVTSAK
jgi:hypothetical protein